MSIINDLRFHAAATHTTDCSGRLYECTCGYDKRTNELLLAAAFRFDNVLRDINELLRESEVSKIFDRAREVRAAVLS